MLNVFPDATDMVPGPARLIVRVVDVPAVTLRVPPLKVNPPTVLPKLVLELILVVPPVNDVPPL